MPFPRKGDFNVSARYQTLSLYKCETASPLQKVRSFMSSVFLSLISNKNLSTTELELGRKIMLLNNFCKNSFQDIFADNQELFLLLTKMLTINQSKPNISDIIIETLQHERPLPICHDNSKHTKLSCHHPAPPDRHQADNSR